MSHVIGDSPFLPVESQYDDFTRAPWPEPRVPGPPVPVDRRFCAPRRPPDYFQPDGTPTWTKPTPGGPVLYGPNGSMVVPTPTLPETPLGLPGNGGEVVGDEGAIRAATVEGGFRWWPWALLAAGIAGALWVSREKRAA